nr:hypothetical protein [Desulfallas thermosapovorans]
MGSIGPVIGLHVGPGSIGIVYYTKEYSRSLKQILVHDK